MWELNFVGGKYAQKKGKMIPRFFIKLKYFSWNPIYEYKLSKIFQILIQLFSKYVLSIIIWIIIGIFLIASTLTLQCQYFTMKKYIVVIVHGVERILARADSEFVCVLKLILRRHCIAYFRSVYWPITAKNDLLFCSCFKCLFQ